MSTFGYLFTPEQRNEYKKYFIQFDRGSKNYLTNDEMKSLLEYIGFKTQKDSFNAFDIINFNTYISILQGKFEKQKLEEEIIQAFEFFDKEKKGFFEVEYFKKLMLSLQEKLTLEEISDMIKEADPDNTGYINYKSFVNSVLIR